jgi:hypothetical protein
MKKLLYLLVVLFTISSLSSCKKCSTCTTYDVDAQGDVTSEFCGKGHVYDDQLKQHKKAGWDCVEN